LANTRQLSDNINHSRQWRS